MAVKTQDAADADKWETSTIAYPTVETIHEDSILKLVKAPAPGVSDEINVRAQRLARRAVAVRALLSILCRTIMLTLKSI